MHEDDNPDANVDGGDGDADTDGHLHALHRRHVAPG
jgi:hypothetical protein